MPKNELRQDPLSKDWVIIAQGRKSRPHDIPDPNKKTKPNPLFQCPFCPGQEEKNIEIFRIESSPRKWIVRSILNKNPYFNPPSEEKTRILTKSDLFPSFTPIGHAEVLIETPYHYKDLVYMDKKELEKVFQAYYLRYCDLAENWEEVVIFRNHGYLAGQSLLHPHSQITAIKEKSPEMKEEEISFLEYYYKHNRCLLCDLVRMEKMKEKRVVAFNKYFIAICPWASKVPYEVMIISLRHFSSFADIKKEEMKSLISIFHEVLRKLFVGLKDPAYNYYFRSFQVEKPFYKKFKTRHFYFKIIPHLSIPGGFEASTESYVNAVAPEEAAEFLRNIELKNYDFNLMYKYYKKNPQADIEKIIEKGLIS